MHTTSKKAWLALLAAVLLAAPAFAQATQAGGTDAQILQDVQKQLGKKQWSNVTATVDDRIVTLSGTVGLYNDKVNAEKKASRVKNVSDVVNNIQVAGDNISDDELFAKLADRLRYDRIDLGIMFNNFDLDVKNGVVTISGNARSPADAASAVAIVQNTAGVKDVIDNIEVAPPSIMDDRLRVAIARAIYRDPVLQKYALDPQAPIRIIVQNGHVTLDGMVLNAMDKQVAGIRANGVAGVFSVKNNLMVANQKPR